MSRLLPAAIVESVVFVFTTVIVALLFKKYRERRKPAALILAVAFGFWEVAIICLTVMRYLAYFAEDLHLIDDSIHYAEIGINLGYLFSAISNILIIAFVAIIFSQSPFFRSTGMFLPFLFGIFNGITIGMIIANILRNPTQPEYSLYTTLYHLILTFISFGSLVIFAFKPLRFASFKWEKVGFRLIILSGLSGICVYLCFVGDVLVTTNYSAFFFLAYVFGILMLIFAYFGFVMPKFIRQRYQEAI